MQGNDSIVSSRSYAKAHRLVKWSIKKELQFLQYDNLTKYDKRLLWIDFNLRKLFC